MIEGYQDFVRDFKEVTTIDLNHYHHSQIQRRLKTIMHRYGLNTLNELISAIRTDEKVLGECLKKLTIHVTEFFRDKEYWDVLKNNILGMIHNRSKLRIWSAGCATGEEAYSLAALLVKTLPSNTWELMASDISTYSLAAAKAGIYTNKSLANLEDTLINSMFEKTGDLYQVKDRIRNKIYFFKHNLLRDTYPQNIDIVLCRNVLIHFNDLAKKHVYHNLAQALNAGGLVFVGGSEQIMEPEAVGLVRDSIYFYRKPK